MSPAPRGTTVGVRHDTTPGRRKPWCASWYVYRVGFTGRPKAKTAWFATEAEAAEFATGLRAALAAEIETAVTATKQRAIHPANTLGTLAGFDYAYDRKADRTDVGPVYSGWLQHVQEQREANTLRSYADAVKNWIAPAKDHARYPGLGRLIISDATCAPKVFADYMSELHKGGATLATRKRVKTALSAFCTWAKFAGRLTGANPLDDLGRLLRKKGERDQKPQPNPFSGDEVVRFFDQLTAAEEDCWVVYFRFLNDVGVRVGEAAALKWTALDLDRKRAQIELAYSGADQLDKLPKTHEVRRVDLTQRLVDLLRRWKVAQAEEAFRRGRKVPVYVFTTRRLARMVPGSGDVVLARTLKACGIPCGKKVGGHTAHDWRDTFATSHLIGSWDRKIAWVSKQLGHATPRTTETFYYQYRDTSASASFADEIVQWEK
jgi:integrase